VALHEQLERGLGTFVAGAACLHLLNKR
jgi:hypothetical protein